jgi:YaiO family outer membrane protein
LIATAPEVPVVVQADATALYRAAVADRQAGRPAEAEMKLRQVLEIRPDDLDARLNLGLSLLALEQLDQAEREFVRVLARAPDYADARLGLARIAQRRGDVSLARREAAEAVRLAPADPDAAALLRTLATPDAATPAWRIDASASRSRLSAGLPDWTEARIALGRLWDGGWSSSVAAEATERFDDRDIYFETRLDRRFGRHGVYANFGGSPDADYRAQASLGSGGHYTLSERLVATVDAAVTRYPSGTVTTLQPGAVVQIVPGHWEFSARWIMVRDESGEQRDGYAAQSRWQATDRLALRLGYADAPETSEGFTVDVSTWSAGLDLGLTDVLTLRVGGAVEDRGAYERRELSLGLGRRF